MHNLIKKWKSDERVDEKKTEADGTQAPLVLSDEAMKVKSRARFRDVQREIFKQPKRVERPTVVFLDDGRQSKNLAYHDKDIYAQLKLRKQAQIVRNGHDVTPKALTESDLVDIEEKYEEDAKKSLWDDLIQRVNARKFSSFRKSDPGDHLNVPDLDDIMADLIDRTDLTADLDMNSTSRDVKDDGGKDRLKVEKLKLLTFQISDSGDIDLFESDSLIVEKGSEEAAAVEKLNADYEYNTKGLGKNRQTSSAEAQTENFLVKSRSSATEGTKEEKETFARSFDIFDTYAELERNMKPLESNEDAEERKDIRKVEENPGEALSRNENFQVSSMVMERLLAGNVYRPQQMRFRNLTLPDPLDLDAKYLYRLETLWSYKSDDTMGKDVVDMSWCPDNGDLLAVAYGVYNFRESKHRISGSVLVWSIKNPVNPERRFRYKVPVTAVEFSTKSPQLLAVALFDGIVEVLDITENNFEKPSVVARSERQTFDPVWQIRWLQLKDGDFILTASQDGRIVKLKIDSGPHLVEHPQMRLDRVEGLVEGLCIEHKKSSTEADHHPQALCLQKHPVKADIYFVGTDEGCVHTCSTSLPLQHVSVLQVHEFGVYAIEFSPFSSKVFLTAGSDWTIRIWIEGILQPIMELSDGFRPFHNAYWSPTHSTIIISCTQDAVQIWDLSRKNQMLASTRTFDNKQLTTIKFSPCGRSLIVGDNEGNAHVCSLEDFPFALYYQCDELQKVFHHSLTNKPELQKEVQELGSLGCASQKEIKLI